MLHSDASSIWRLPTAKLQSADNQEFGIWRSATAKLEEWATPPERLFYRINYTSLSILSSIDNPLKRAFYEQESIRGCWTNTELDRQISSQYYERMGLSKDKKALQKLAVKNVQQLAPRDILHNPVTLEFLGLESQDVYTETKLESYILNHLQSFLLEMGRGFCFEARQKRILIDQDYFKADLIFYHRILKCHVIIDLKIDRFRHEYASQLNLYMNFDELAQGLRSSREGAESIRTSMEALDALGAAGREGLEEVAEAAEELSEAVETIRREGGKFKLPEDSILSRENNETE